MDRYWLLTWTTYGSWLPGDARGFVSNVADASGRGVRHNTPDTAPAARLPALRSFAESKMVSAAVRLTRPQAAAVCDQFLETALFRGWDLRAVAVMANHVHLVVGVPGDPEPDSLLRDFKSYASRRLNCQFGRQPRWWTQSGSTRILPNQEATESAVEYVKAQEYPLVVWVAEGERPA